VSNKEKFVLIAIPAYDSKVFAIGMTSIFQNMKNLEDLGYKVTFTLQLAGAYIDLQRNHLVKTFLENPAYTDLIFVDNDLAFDADAMVKLMKHDVPVIGGVYPYRSEAEDGYPIDIKLDGDNYPVADLEKGLIECDHIPTGMMRVQRNVFDTLREKYGHMVDDKGEFQIFGTGFLKMYEQVVERLINKIRQLQNPSKIYDTSLPDIDINDPYRGLDNRWWGEDVYFCRMCNDCGIKVYIDPTITFVHFGTLNKSGRYADYLKNGGSVKKPGA
jgi:hypothetical protein